MQYIKFAEPSNLNLILLLIAFCFSLHSKLRSTIRDDFLKARLRKPFGVLFDVKCVRSTETDRQTDIPV